MPSRRPGQSQALWTPRWQGGRARRADARPDQGGGVGASDDSFVVCARTDARAIEGLDAAIERAKAYADAGADLIFTEALTGPAEFETFRKAVDVPLLANMTEFGRSELVSAKQLEELGFNAVIYPVTTLRLAMFAIEHGLREIDATGTQSELLGTMQHRSRLYELLRYPEYNTFDQNVFDFTIPGGAR